ncbi:MAG: histidinol dehydrogenase [Treponema sp.]|nr:histidinol dehydrogenase [Treponema sp.]MCL2273013.1 histidinol dehydrogenase [Treponema sp.]
MKIIQSKEFGEYWKKNIFKSEDKKTEETVKNIIADVRDNGDEAVKKYSSKFDKSSPDKLEVPFSEAKNALVQMHEKEPDLTEAIEFAADNIYRFSLKQKEQFKDFEFEIQPGLFTGQRIIPVQRAAVYVPGGRFPLFSSVLMCMIPALCAGAEEVILCSPPAENGIPNQKILAAAANAANVCGISDNRLRIFTIGGAQAIAALAYGTESVPRCDIICGPGNRFVAAAKRQLYGQVGIDFIAGPSDVLIITDGKNNADFAAVDMIAQAEHDPDARARALVPDLGFAEKLAAAVETRVSELPSGEIARTSLENALVVVYKNREEAVKIANIIAPEHLELQTEDAHELVPLLKNYGSLFIGSLSAEVLGDYSAGVNHTLPTETSARFTGGLSVRHFLKIVTTLRCEDTDGFEKARNAAEIIARTEGLEGHAISAASRRRQ